MNSFIQNDANMSRFIPNATPCGRTRREFLWQAGGGFAGLALIDLMTSAGLLAEKAGTATSALAAKPPHFPAKAKHCVFLFMNGGPSQVDTFDPKPTLAKFHGMPYQGDAKVGSNGRPIGHLMQSPFEFQKHGRVSGTQDETIEVRGVPMAALSAVARPYWVKRVAPLPVEQ